MTKNNKKEGDRMYIVIVTLKDGKRYTKQVDTYEEAVYLCLLIKKYDDDVQSVTWYVV